LGETTEQLGPFFRKSSGVQGMWVRIEKHAQRMAVQHVETINEPEEQE
jgi:hypothetical protein